MGSSGWFLKLQVQSIHYFAVQVVAKHRGGGGRKLSNARFVVGTRGKCGKASGKGLFAQIFAAQRCFPSPSLYQFVHSLMY